MENTSGCSFILHLLLSFFLKEAMWYIEKWEKGALDFIGIKCITVNLKQKTATDPWRQALRFYFKDKFNSVFYIRHVTTCCVFGYIYFFLCFLNFTYLIKFLFLWTVNFDFQSFNCFKNFLSVILLQILNQLSNKKVSIRVSDDNLSFNPQIDHVRTVLSWP